MDVGAWLRELGLGQYEQAFNDNAVDGEVLPRLTADDLKRPRRGGDRPPAEAPRRNRGAGGTRARGGGHAGA